MPQRDGFVVLTMLIQKGSRNNVEFPVFQVHRIGGFLGFAVDQAEHVQMILPPQFVIAADRNIVGSVRRCNAKGALSGNLATLKEKFQGSGLKLSAEMAQYIVRTGQKEQFAEYQRNNARQQGEERS